MTALEHIEQQAARYAYARGQAAELSRLVADEIEAVKRRHRARLQNAAAILMAEYQRLHDAVEAAPELFERPRTQVYAGIRVGYQKGKGGIEIPDPARTVALIRRHLPEMAAALLAEKVTPVKSALAQLAVAELKRIGCLVVDAADQVVVKPVDTAVDKWLDAMLAELAAEAEEVAP